MWQTQRRGEPGTRSSHPRVFMAHNQISRWRYFVNKLLRSLLKTAVYLLEQSDRDTGDMADRVKDRVQNSPAEPDTRFTGERTIGFVTRLALQLESASE